MGVTSGSFGRQPLSNSAEAIAARSAQRPLAVNLPARSDKAMCVLSSVIDRACHYHRHNGTPNPERWLAAADVLNAVRSQTMELVIATSPSLFANPASGVQAPSDLFEAVYPTLTRIGRLRPRAPTA